MPSFLINDDEREALRGLPMLAREIYVFGLRPFMDYRTGLVGERRGISWKSIAEELYVEPHQGIKGGEPSEKELRRALTWLQKVELVGPNQAERRLIFQLLKASRDQSARNKVGSKWADEAGSYVGGPEASNNGPYTEEEGREAGGGESGKVGTPPVTGENHTVPLARDEFEIHVEKAEEPGPGRAAVPHQEARYGQRDQGDLRRPERCRLEGRRPGREGDGGEALRRSAGRASESRPSPRGRAVTTENHRGEPK